MTRVQRPLDRRIFALAIPALGALAADPLLSLADTAFIARLGTTELAALGVDTALYSIAFLAFNFLAYATTPMVARLTGRGERQAAGRVVTAAFYLAMALGAMATAVLVVAARPLVGLMQAAPEVADPAVSYLRIRALAAPAVLAVLAGHGAFRGLQDMRTPLWITLAINLVNLVLDPLFIFGLGWGLEGAAIATVIAQWIGAGWFLRALVRRGEGWSWRRPGWMEVRPLLGTGGVLTVRTLFLSGTLALATGVAAAIGTAEVAAHQVVAQTWFLMAMIVDSLAISAQAMVAERIGSGDPEGVAALVRRLVWWGMWAGLGLMSLLLLGRGGLASVFGPDPVVASLISSAAVVCALMQPLAALVFVADGIFLGLLRVRFLAYSTAAGAVAAGAVFWLTLERGWGLVGVWWGVAAMVTARLVVLAAAYPGSIRG